MSERDRIITLLHWYNTPASGVIDHEAWIIAKPIIDDLMFRLASLDSGTKINVLPLFDVEIQFFGETRSRYTPMVEINATKRDRVTRMQAGRLKGREMPVSPDSD